MRFTVSQPALAAMLTKIQGIVPSKPSLPILSNVLLEVIGNELILTVTDLVLTLKAYLPVHVQEEGSIALPAKRFFSLIRELTNPEVHIHANEADIAFIESAASQFKIPGISSSEFPSIELPEGNLPIPFSSSLLREILAKTVFAAGHDDTKAVFNGVLIQRIGSLTTFTATDGRLLSKTYLDVSLPSEWQGSFILPQRVVNEIIHLLDTKEEESLTLSFSDDKVCVETRSITLISQLIVGDYPDVTRIIPNKGPSPIRLHREEMMTLLRQVGLFAPNSQAPVRFHFSEGQLVLSAESGLTGEGRVSMPVNYQGESIEIAFNPGYFLDILRHTKGETVNLEITNPYNPGLITEEVSPSLFVLMPMRLDT